MITDTRRLLPLLALLTACSQPELKPVTEVAPEIQSEQYALAELAGARIFELNSTQSVVLIYVTRAGRMKHLGHDHVVASENLSGFVQVTDDLVGSTADLQIALRDLVVDAPKYRHEFGLDSDVSENAIRGTYRNMQAEVLESAEYPYAQISVEYLLAGTANHMLRVSVNLHGAATVYDVPVALEVDEDRLTVSGELTIAHSDFNLQPFSAVGGLLSVAEPMELRFLIVANRTRLVADQSET